MLKKNKPSEILGLKDPKEILHAVQQWSSDLSKEEHLTKSIVQEIHQNCEIKMDRIIYKLLSYCVPKGDSDNEIKVTEEELWEEIGKFPFEQKLRLIKPVLKKWHQTDPSVLEISNINDIRRQCAHLRQKNKKANIQYKGYKLFNDPEALGRIFADAWGIGKALDDIGEWIDDQHAWLEKHLPTKA